MQPTVTTAPSILKPALVFIAAATMLVMSGHVSARELAPTAHAYAGEPMVRIRGDKVAHADAVAAADAFAARPTTVALSRADAPKDRTQPTPAV